MKNYNKLYYLLTVLLIMGAFASMAQNGYGVKILGAVAIGFAFLFLLELLQAAKKRESAGVLIRLELVDLCIISVLFALRIFQVHFPFIEWIFVLAGASLILVYLKRMTISYKTLHVKNPALSNMVGIFHLCVIFFVLGLIIVPFTQRMATWAGGIALVLLIIFLVYSLLNRKYMLDGNNVTPLLVIARYHDRSILLIALFFLVSLYLTLTSTGILPRIYSDQYPQAYFELVKQAETGKEMPVNGSYKHEAFKKMFEQFTQKDIPGK